MNRKKYINKIISSAVIAGLYAGITYFCGLFGLSYGPIQLRASEALTVLSVFSPTAVYGLTVGCFLANIASFNPLDMFFGTGATLIASLLTYLFRNIKIGKFPFLSLLCPIVINGLIVGLELSILSNVRASFFLLALWVVLGEAITVFGLGTPLYFFILKERQKFNNFF